MPISGGPGQLSHLAPTYAAVLALCTQGTREAFAMINRPALQHFLLRMHQDDGSYIMHEDGEKDIRSVIGSKIVLGLTLLRGCRGSKDRYQVMC